MRAKWLMINEPEWILPIEYLEVGQSFFIPTVKPAPLLYAVDCASKRLGIRTKSYITEKEGMLGVRTWRIR